MLYRQTRRVKRETGITELSTKPINECMIECDSNNDRVMEGKAAKLNFDNLDVM